MSRAMDLTVLRQLSNKHGRVYPTGSLVFAEGETSAEFYVVLQGKVEISKEIPGEGGGMPQNTVIATLGSGDVLGEMAAFTGEPRSATAVAVEDTSVLFFDQQTAIALLRVSPQFGLDIVRALAERLRTNNDRLTALEHQVAQTASVQTPRRAATKSEAAPAEVDEERFLAKSVECPVSQTAFSVLNVRSQVLRPGNEESDFHRPYEGISPLHYAIQVCPECLYAAYPDDFATVTPQEAERLAATAPQRLASRDRHNFRKERTLAMANRSFDLAERCYALRQVKDAKRARLYHERAWIARELGDAVLEREYLGKAMAAYRAAVERDPSSSGFQQVRLIFLIGELALRLGKEQEALTWFGQAMQHEHYKKQPALVKLVQYRRAIAQEQITKKRG